MKCDCQNPEPDHGVALVSNVCPVHNLFPKETSHPHPQGAEEMTMTWFVVANGSETAWMSADGWVTDVEDALHFSRRKDADAYAALSEDAIYIRSSVDFECLIPPEGWYCTRLKGHEGPCAAEQYASPYRESHGSVTSRRRTP